MSCTLSRDLLYLGEVAVLLAVNICMCCVSGRCGKEVWSGQTKRYPSHSAPRISATHQTRYTDHNAHFLLLLLVCGFTPGAPACCAPLPEHSYLPCNVARSLLAPISELRDLLGIAKIVCPRRGQELYAVIGAHADKVGKTDRAGIPEKPAL